MKNIIAFAWWWTWWHIFPIKTLIENIDKNKYKILWFWSKNSLEEKISKNLYKNWYDIQFISIYSWKIRREFNISNFYLNIIDCIKNIIWFFQSFFFVLKYKPKFVFSKWWYVAFNPSFVAKILWTKVYLHESDTVPWLVNKIVGKFADKIFIWFKSASKYFKNDRTKIVWQILDNKFFIEKWIYSKTWKTNLLIIWWSQWSKIIIEWIKNLLDMWCLQEFNIFIVWWILNKVNLFAKYKNVKFYWFLSQDDLINLYKKTDISITRWSATSLAEQDQFDIKKIIVPLPFTGWNHQYFNAVEYKKKWDILISQLDKNFINNLEAVLQKFSNYKKIEGTYRKEVDNKNIILKSIL